jgi:hypothetical protein
MSWSTSAVDSHTFMPSWSGYSSKFILSGLFASRPLSCV